VIVEANDQEKLFRASNTIKALSLGFSLDESRGLMNSENYLLMVPLRAELPPRDERKKTSSSSSRSRLFSLKSVNMRVIQKFTGVAFKLRDDNLWMIGPTDSVIEASREARQIIMGRTRGTVQQYHRGKRGIRLNPNRR